MYVFSLNFGKTRLKLASEKKNFTKNDGYFFIFIMLVFGYFFLKKSSTTGDSSLMLLYIGSLMLLFIPSGSTNCCKVGCKGNLFMHSLKFFSISMNCRNPPGCK